MGERRLARELALKALFCCDTGKEEDPKELLKLFCLNFKGEFKDLKKESIYSFFYVLVNGVLESSKEIDGFLKKCSKNWRISRMSIVDRNIMRIAIFELLKCPDIPSNVSINEALEISKKYSDTSSGPFINGVLDHVLILIKTK